MGAQVPSDSRDDNLRGGLEDERGGSFPLSSYFKSYFRLAEAKSQFARLFRKVSTYFARGVAVIDVIGVFPDVAGEQRSLALGDRILGVVARLD